MTSRALRRALLRAVREGQLEPEALTPLALTLAGLRPEPELSQQQVARNLRVLARTRTWGQRIASVIEAARRLGFPGRWRDDIDATWLRDLRGWRQCLAAEEEEGWAVLRDQLGSWAAVRRLLVSARAAGIAIRSGRHYVRYYHRDRIEAWDAASGCWWRYPLTADGDGTWARMDPRKTIPPIGLQRELPRLGTVSRNTPAEVIAVLGREIERLRRIWPEGKVQR